MNQRRRTRYQKRGGWRPGLENRVMPEHLKRNKQTKVTWNDDEFAQLNRGMAHFGFSNRAEFVRHAALELANKGIQGL
jgi:hypothetical protein